MLDLAFGLTQTSRLGCQVEASKELDGLVVRLPSVRALPCDACVARARATAADPRHAQATRNFAVDGHTPKPH